MKILVTGSSGLIGSALVSFLSTHGQVVVRLLRTTPRPGQTTLYWDPTRGVLKQDYLEGFDAVVHLAGESIAFTRWTSSSKERIRRSRVEGTRLLCDSLARVRQPPRVLLSASAVGFYGDRGDELLREDSVPGTGFLSGVCREWERATQPAVSRGIRVVHLRFGVVLSPHGGALAKMLPLFRWGLGGVVGSGRQYLSWVSLDDAVGAVFHALKTQALQGPANIVSPHPVTNREFTETLGRLLDRPAFFAIPAFAARLAFGQMADELLLASTRAEPAQLIKTGYAFQHAFLEKALHKLLSARS
jgi:hypothetical protein